MDAVTLEGYVVRRCTANAIGICKAVTPLGLREDLTWVPRSLCEDGETLEEGDTDIVVAQWKADQEGLDY